ncbi:MAG TPA: M1 family aminopeptidase, partial [Gemmatimonadales bacterium]|nr:M1 family aminopeptidase [Gemmatimonadales bacterium]
ALTVPAGWLVSATGVLQNPEQVLSKTVRDRLARTRKTRDIVHVVTEADRGAGRATAAASGGEGTLTWRFRAENVRDVVWGTSAEWLWDATQATTGAAGGDRKSGAKSGTAGTAAIYSFWRPDGRASAWQENNRYLRYAIEFLSKYLWPYPYPVMNALHGPDSCGGMEYPMATCIGRARDTTGMFGVTIHETAHMWFPMQVGSNETAHGWQDEGLTQFNEAQASRAFFADTNLVHDERDSRNSYLALARSGLEQPMMRHGDLYPSYFAYAISSYSKTASLLTALRALLGEETFDQAYREYGRRWQFKHPTPYDMWRTFDQVSGRDLWWFWRSWFFEDWRLDQAIAGVAVRGDSAAITVEDRGLVPMPVRLAVTHADGSV